MGLAALAFLWGLAEASLFFLVPDILITTVAVNDLSKSLRLSISTLLGALIGGMIMYGCGSMTPLQAERFLDLVPAISPQAVLTVRAETAHHGVWAVFLGPLSAVPYKIYAVEAGALALDPRLFLALSIPARLGRFMLLAIAANLICRFPLAALEKDTKCRLVLAGWTAFYFYYFATTPG